MLVARAASAAGRGRKREGEDFFRGFIVAKRARRNMQKTSSTADGSRSGARCRAAPVLLRKESQLLRADASALRVLRGTASLINSSPGRAAEAAWPREARLIAGATGAAGRVAAGVAGGAAGGAIGVADAGAVLQAADER
jgi:hypothetical protein